MAKFCVGDRVVCVNASDLQGYGMKVGDEHTIQFCGDGCMFTEQVGITRPVAQWCSSRFELVKSSLRSLYESEKEKLDKQATLTQEAYNRMEDQEFEAENARKAIIHAKRIQVSIMLDNLERAQGAYDIADAELDEMLRNEPF